LKGIDSVVRCIARAKIDNLALLRTKCPNITFVKLTKVLKALGVTPEEFFKGWE
jgi:DNA-binding Xre family transcriptional regulator